MDFFIAPSIGAGDGIIAEPAIEFRVTEELEKFDLSSKIIVREDANHAFEAQAKYKWTEQVRFVARYQSTPGEFYDGLNREDTVHVGAEIDFAETTLTADFSPDAFGAGKRARFGVKYGYELNERLTADVHARVRHLTRQDNWKQQTNVNLNYQMAPDKVVSLSFIQHDFFDDATVLRYTWKSHTR